MLGQLDIYMQKNEVGLLCHIEKSIPGTKTSELKSL